MPKKYHIRPVLLLSVIVLLSGSCRDNVSRDAQGKTEQIIAPENEPVINPVVNDTLSSFPTAPANDSIFEAALSGMRDEVIRMLDKGSDINGQDKDGRTVLMYASYDGHSELIRDLLNRSAKVNLQDLYGRTALMLASSGPFPDAVKLLLDHNADPNIVDKEEHFSALMYAAAEGQLEVVKILLKYQADPKLKDVDGDDAVTFARNNGHEQVAAYLIAYTK